MMSYPCTSYHDVLPKPSSLQVLFSPRGDFKPRIGPLDPVFQLFNWCLLTPSTCYYFLFPQKAGETLFKLVFMNIFNLFFLSLLTE